VEIIGNVAVIAKGQNGISLADISRSQSPKLIGNFATPTNVVSVTHRGDRLYLGMGLNGLVQTSLNQLGAAGVATSVVVEGGAQKVIATDRCLVVMGKGVTLLDPQSLSLLSSLTITGACRM